MRRLKISDLHSFNIEKALTWIVSALAFLFPVTVLTVNRADSVILLLLGVIGIYAFLRYGVRGLHLNRQELLLMAVFAGWYAVIVLCYFTGDKTPDGFRLLGRCLRLLFFIPAYITCRQYLNRPYWLFGGLVLAPFMILGLALQQYNPDQNWIRAAGFTDAISFGDLTLVAAFAGLSMLLLVKKRRRAKRFLPLLVGVGLLAGIVVSLLSETRGGWIALPVFILVSVLVISDGSKKRGLQVLGIFTVLILVAIWLVPGNKVNNRIKEAVNSLTSYLDFLKLEDRGDLARQGCLNDPSFLQYLAYGLERSYGNRFVVGIVDDHTALKEAGLLGQCQFGEVIKLSNKSHSRIQIATFNRFVSDPSGYQKIQFIMRGQGSIAINGIAKGAAYFHSTKYILVTTFSDTGKTYRAIPYIFVAPGSEVYFVPVQEQTGEYIYPLVDNSIGQRLEMWRTAWHIFLKHPLLGAGTGAYMHMAKIQAEKGKAMPSTANFDHPHSDYLNSMASWGLLGLCAWLLVILYPLKLYRRALQSSVRAIKSAAYVGSIITAGLLIFSFTETMFTHSIVMSWYVTFTAMLMAVIFRHQTTEISNDRN